MVDFNNETTVGTPALDVVKIIILQRQFDLIEAWESYNKKNTETDADPNIFQARLFSLFMQIEALLHRRFKKEEYEELYKLVRSHKVADSEKAYLIINRELDNLNLTKIDIRRKIDTTRVENENREKGL